MFPSTVFYRSEIGYIWFYVKFIYSFHLVISLNVFSDWNIFWAQACGNYKFDSFVAKLILKLGLDRVVATLNAFLHLHQKKQESMKFLPGSGQEGVLERLFLHLTNAYGESCMRSLSKKLYLFCLVMQVCLKAPNPLSSLFHIIKKYIRCNCMETLTLCIWCLYLKVSTIFLHVLH